MNIKTTIFVFVAILFSMRSALAVAPHKRSLSPSAEPDAAPRPLTRQRLELPPMAPIPTSAFAELNDPDLLCAIVMSLPAPAPVPSLSSAPRVVAPAAQNEEARRRAIRAIDQRMAKDKAFAAEVSAAGAVAVGPRVEAPLSGASSSSSSSSRPAPPAGLTAGPILSPPAFPPLVLLQTGAAAPAPSLSSTPRVVAPAAPVPASLGALAAGMNILAALPSELFSHVVSFAGLRAQAQLTWVARQISRDVIQERIGWEAQGLPSTALYLEIPFEKSPMRPVAIGGRLYLADGKRVFEFDTKIQRWTRTYTLGDLTHLASEGDLLRVWTTSGDNWAINTITNTPESGRFMSDPPAARPDSDWRRVGNFQFRVITEGEERILYIADSDGGNPRRYVPDAYYRGGDGTWCFSEVSDPVIYENSVFFTARMGESSRREGEWNLFQFEGSGMGVTITARHLNSGSNLTGPMHMAITPNTIYIPTVTLKDLSCLDDDDFPAVYVVDRAGNGVRQHVLKTGAKNYKKRPSLLIGDIFFVSSSRPSTNQHVISVFNAEGIFREISVKHRVLFLTHVGDFLYAIHRHGVTVLNIKTLLENRRSES